MLKRVAILFISLCIAIFFTSIPFAQEKPATTEATSAEAAGTQEVKAKVYYDGTNTYVNSSVQFRLSSKDNVLLERIEYRINNSETMVYSQPFTIAAEGKNIISFYGVDKIGNKEDVKVFKIVVDSSAPQLIVSADKPVTKVNDKIYVSKEFTFSIQSKDSLSGVNRVDFLLNNEPKEYVTPFNIIADGDVTLGVKGADNVNNSTNEFSLKIVDSTGKEELIKGSAANISVDNAAPAVQITPDAELKEGANNRKVASPDVKYSISASDQGAGVETILVRVDGKGDFEQYLNEIKLKANGEHTIEAKAVDKVGNASAVATLSVFVDVLPPESKIDTIPE